MKTLQTIRKRTLKETRLVHPKIDRTECRGIVGIITGHSNNGKHLARMGLVNDATCQSCLEEEDTPEHRLCECLAFSRIRLNMLGVESIETKNLHSMRLEDILKCSKRTRINF